MAVKRTTKLPLATEFQEQCALFKWAGLHVKQYPELEFLFHVPNGELRAKATAGKLKAAGVKSGVPDVVLLEPRAGYCGILIEMKRRGEVPSPNQIKWAKQLIKRGYNVHLCYDWIQASEALVSYLTEKCVSRDERDSAEPLRKVG